LADGSAGPDLLTAYVPATYRETALYGDVTWKFANGLSLTGGLRVAHNSQHYTQSTEGLLVAPGPTIDASSGDTSRTWLLAARYNLSPAISVYARAATGYRPGGPNAVLRDPATGQPQGPLSFQPDTLASVELGYKASLLDKRLSIETAAYHLDWKDLQQFLAVNGVSMIVNAGAARVNGAELVMTWRPNEHWTLTGNTSVIDAKLSEDAPGLGAKAGARLPVSARFSASLGADHAFQLGDRRAYVGASVRYVGQRNVGFEGSAASPLYKLPAYSLTDLRAGIEFGRVDLALFVRNLFDKRAQLGAVDAVSTLGGPMWVSQARPRTVGATLTLPF
jgi:iron complex outermembrane recepter protein